MSVVTRRWRTLALSAALVGVAGSANAQSWSGAMSGANEVPPNASTATGWAYLSLTGSSLFVQIFWNALTGGVPAAAHIHCCTTPGTNVNVAVGFPGFPAATSGTYTHTFDLFDPTIYTSAFLNNFGGGTAAGAESALIAGLDAGRAYVNIHNATFPGGEIRADVLATPEPLSVALLATGLVVATGLGVKRRPRT